MSRSKPLEDWRKKQIKNQVDHEVMRKVYLKYLIMRIRSKISFMAFMKRQTILELFIKAILRSYNHLTMTKQIFPRFHYPPEKIKIGYQRIIAGDIGSCFLAIVDLHLEDDVQ